ncbi:MAG TPA: Crp/Fnr family transcriptional regulator [Polyangiaceae bacterium]|nr:Crp/Fnr family transcriptional regulator [Polyangiaceae bacterium]
MSQKLLQKHRTLLRAIPLFESLSEEDLAKVGALAQIRSFPARAVVVTQGEPAAALFAIVTGRLKVSTSDREGRDTVLGIMGAGEVFGEVALIDGGARSATCIAVEPCTLLVLDRDLFMELLATSPGIAVKLLHVLAQRLRRLSQRSEDAAFLDVPSRLARSLLELAARFGERALPPHSGIRITLKLSQQELGDLVGATRESVNKHLSDWTRQGLLTVQSGHMLISDIQGVRRLARLHDD